VNPYTPPRTDEPTKPAPSLESLKKQRSLLALGASLVAFSAGMKLAGVFAVGFIPVWAEWILVAFLVGSCASTSWKIRKVEQRQGV
jgi:hypothetical protein